MEFETLTQMLQKGFRVTLGAASSAVDALQDPQRTSEKFSTIGPDFERLTDELEVRGALTEKEAREFVDNLNLEFPNPFVPTPAGNATVNTTATPVVDAGLQAEIASLTEQLVSIRQEIEDLKAQG